MSARTTLRLVLVLAALLAYLLLTGRGGRDAHEAPPLLPVPPGAVTRLVVLWPDARLVAARGPGGWLDERGAPLAAPVDDLLSALAAVRPIALGRPQDGTRADYGLVHPQAHVEASAAAGMVLSLEVGARNPSWTGVYVERAGAAQVLLVGALLHWELEKLRAAVAAASAVSAPQTFDKPGETGEPLQTPKEDS